MFSFLSQDPPQTLEEKEALFNSLVSTAENNIDPGFSLITHISEWRDTRAAIKGMRKIIVMFKQIADEMIAIYLKQLAANTPEFPYLCSYSKYKTCMKYYEQQLAIAEGLLEEYWKYIDTGHFLEQFLFFKERPIELCYDHRSKSKK